LDNKNNQQNICVNEQLRKRVMQNYATFKASTLQGSKESIYDKAHKIAAAEDTYNVFMTWDTEKDDAEYLLTFCNPLVMLADYLLQRQVNYPLFDDALGDLTYAEDNEVKYLTVEFVEELRRKHGMELNVKTALTMEAVESLQRYLHLSKLASGEGGCFCSNP